MGWFSRQPSIEKRLKKIYVPMIMSMKPGTPSSEAGKKIFSEWLRETKEDARKETTDNLPPNYGDWLLEKEATDPNIKFRLAKARKDGARDEDIRIWWNLPDLERRLMLE